MSDYELSDCPQCGGKVARALSNRCQHCGQLFEASTPSSSSYTRPSYARPSSEDFSTHDFDSSYRGALDEPDESESNNLMFTIVGIIVAVLVLSVLMSPQPAYYDDETGEYVEPGRTRIGFIILGRSSGPAASTSRSSRSGSRGGRTGSGGFGFGK